MEITSRECKRVYKYCVLLCVAIAAVFITHCDARKSRVLIMRDQNQNQQKGNSMITKAIEELKVITHIDGGGGDPSSNIGPYGVSSPFTLPPFDSLAPENTPPYCIYPPFTPPTTITNPPSPTPTPPSYISPILPILNPPPSPIGGIPAPPESPNPPETIPSPPESVPTPYVSIPSPSGTPPYYEPGPPSFVPSPPSPSGFVPSPPSSSVPSPSGFVPSPPVFLPPIVYPPPTSRPPPPGKGPSIALWCVAKPSVPDPIIQEAMNYACGSGADCETIQSSGPCFEPNTVYAHASYALNSYWQRTKVAGGTCSFGGTAMLVTVDPSHNGCHFIYA